MTFKKIFILLGLIPFLSFGQKEKIFTLSDSTFTKGHHYRTKQITFDKSNAYTDQSKATVDSIYNFLLKNKNLAIEVGVHVDKTDSKSSDLQTQMKAQGLVDSLVKMGIDKNRLFAKGFGATQKIINEEIVRPVARTKEEAKWMYDQNNRVELRIISTTFNLK